MKVSRRELLKWSVAGGVAASASGLVIPLLRNLAPAQARVEVEKKPPVAPSPHGEATKHRHWSMIIDLRKCEGCTTIDAPPQCTQACIQEHFVPQGQQWIEVFEEELPTGGTSFMPAPCYQCENAPCVNVCPVGASYHSPEGIVLIDHNRCIGCRLCMAACPYQRRFFNWGQPKVPPEAAFANYSPEYPVPAKRGTVIKCMFCAHRAREGKLPACVEGCPMKALYFGDLNEDIATNGAELVQLRRFLGENNAFRYKEDLGTQPRVWYIPGHGEAFGHHSRSHKERLPNRWPWGEES